MRTMTMNNAHTRTSVDELLVVKLGGGAGLSMARCVADLADLALWRPLVIVHGVSERANALCIERRHPPQMLTSPGGHDFRYTDPITRDIYVEAARQINDELVDLLRERGVPAVGLSDERVAIYGERKRALRAVTNGRVRIIRDDYSGAISEVDAAAIRELLDQGLIPVLPPLAWDEQDGFLNVDGDRASAAVATALDAYDLIILSNVRGVYRDFPDENSLVSRISMSQIDAAEDWAQGRMKRKILGAREALEGGVRRVIISDGRANQPVLSALAGSGTVFER